MEEKVFKLIDKISKEHSKKVFGYLKEEDIRNEIWLICLDRLKDFDGKRGELEHFLRFSVKNRLINKFKEITKTVRCPCIRCPEYRKDQSPDCHMFKYDKHLCDKWSNYRLSTESRNSLLNASEPKVERESDQSLENQLSGQEFQQFILNNIDKSYHYDIEQIVSNGKISKQRIKKLKREVLRILAKNDRQDGNFAVLTVNGVAPKVKKRRRRRKKSKLAKSNKKAKSKGKVCPKP